MIILQSTVLTYAFFFAINHEFKQVAQGIGLFGLLAVLIWSTQALARTEATAQVSTEDAAAVTRVST